MNRARWLLAGVVLFVLVVAVWGWLQRNGRLRAEGELAAAHRATADAVARADSAEDRRAQAQRQHEADSVRLAQQRDAALAQASQAYRARNEAVARARAAAEAVATATAGVLEAAGDSATVVTRLATLVQAHEQEVSEYRVALEASDLRAGSLEKALAATDSALTSTRRLLAEERAARLAEQAAKEAALAEVRAHEAARPGFFERALRVVVPVVAFVGGVWVGAQAAG